MASEDERPVLLRGVGLRVRDLRVMEGFYVGLLGFGVAWRPSASTLHLALGPSRLWLEEAELIAPRGALACLWLELPTARAVDLLCQRLAGAGARVVEPAAQAGDGSYGAAVLDPEDNVVRLVASGA